MDTSEVPESWSTKINFDDIWVDYIIWCFKWNFETLGIGDRFNTDWKTSVGFGTFNLEVKKTKSTRFHVVLNRKRENISMPMDDGCYLTCNITVVGVDKPRTIPMRFGACRVGWNFHYNEIDNRRKDSEICTVLCVIKMSETSALSNEESRKQNRFIEDLKTNENAEIMEDMAFLLKRKSLENIFTGRQSTDFAKLKTGMIARTLPFAREIAKKFRYKQMNIKYEPKTSPEVYLGYIFDKDVGRINMLQLFKLYINAQFCGLQYLVSECVDLMLVEAEPEELVRILWLFELSFDSELSKKGTRLFLENREKILKTSTWNYFAKSEPHIRCILHAVRRNFKAEGNRILELRQDFISSVKEAMRELDEELLMEREISPTSSEMRRPDSDEDQSTEESEDEEDPDIQISPLSPELCEQGVMPPPAVERNIVVADEEEWNFPGRFSTDEDSGLEVY